MVENKKIALVTGASSGIGSATAIELAQKNVHVIITGKTLSGLQVTESKIKLDGGTSTIAQLDMNDFVGIDRLGMEIFKRWGKLDILISNAAVLGILGPLHHQSSEDFFDVININLLSNHRLIRSMDALLKKSTFSKALFLSSSMASTPKSFWGAYAISKAALNHMVKIWANENKNNNLSIIIVNPGKTRTKMRAKAMPGENEKVLQTPEEVAKKIVNFIFLNKVSKGKVFDILQI
ncbi:SDR family NAD(P)-dependent oxidoreductase [Pseudomonadota bacterium]|nr:SDR family NAD(P)-dependent oxidoreductase [Pseudomonadota bacterium]